MRIYSSVIDAVKETERELFEMGVESHPFTVQDIDVRNDSNYDCKELIGYGYVITGFHDLEDLLIFFFNEYQIEGIKLYCKAELFERLSTWVPSNPGISWKFREEYWKRFLDDNGKFSYTYPERMWFQIWKVVEELKRNPESRQCLITIYDQNRDLGNIGGKKRIPCSMYYHFLIRKISGINRLQMVYNMRSCDFYTHYPIDLYLGVRIGQEIGEWLKVELYSFTHFIGSLHAFRKDFGKRRIF